MSTPAEMAKRYFKHIYNGGSLYDADADADAERHTTAKLSDTEGPYLRPSDTEYPHSRPNDTEGSDLEGGSRSPVRHRQVQFVLPTQPRPGGDSRLGFRGHPEVCTNSCTALFNLKAVGNF